MRLASPAFLMLLVLVPLVLAVPLGRGRRGATLIYSSIRILRRVGGASRRRRIGWLGGLRAAGLALLVLAMARPQIPGDRAPRRASGLDIVLTLDASGSMKGQDFFLEERRVTRLEAVQSVVRDFIRDRENDRIGLVVFGEHAFTQSPLTLNYEVLLEMLDAIEFGVAGDTTAIGNALARSVQRLRDSEARTKVVILLSDGVSNAGNITVEQATEAAQAYAVRVYTIGIGTGRETEVSFVDSLGVVRSIRQNVQLDEDALRRIAEATGGRYYRAADTEELRKVYDEIDSLERAPLVGDVITSWRELFPWILLLATAVIVTEAILARTRFQTLP